MKLPAKIIPLLNSDPSGMFAIAGPLTGNSVMLDLSDGITAPVDSGVLPSSVDAFNRGDKLYFDTDGTFLKVVPVDRTLKPSTARNGMLPVSFLL